MEELGERRKERSRVTDSRGIDQTTRVRVPGSPSPRVMRIRRERIERGHAGARGNLEIWKTRQGVTRVVVGNCFLATLRRRTIGRILNLPPSESFF